MADRYWKIGWGYGFVGTDSEEEIDLVDFMGLSEDEIKEKSQESVQEELDKLAWEQAIEQVESWSEPIEN